MMGNLGVGLKNYFVSLESKICSYLKALSLYN